MSRGLCLSPRWNRHPKIKSLRRKLGADSVLSLLNVWTCAVEHQYFFMDLKEIEIVSEYSSDLDAFIAALTELGFILKTGDRWEICLTGFYASHPENKP